MKFPQAADSVSCRLVTPFGECGLKWLQIPQNQKAEPGHSLRGVWVEISHHVSALKRLICHSLRGVWVEILLSADKSASGAGHSLRGVWVEILIDLLNHSQLNVTPFGECGLK